MHWEMPEGETIEENNILATDISINCISVNPQGVLVAAGKVKLSYLHSLFAFLLPSLIQGPEI